MRRDQQQAGADHRPVAAAEDGHRERVGQPQQRADQVRQRHQEEQLLGGEGEALGQQERRAARSRSARPRSRGARRRSTRSGCAGRRAGRCRPRTARPQDASRRSSDRSVARGRRARPRQRWCRLRGPRSRHGSSGAGRSWSSGHSRWSGALSVVARGFGGVTPEATWRSTCPHDLTSARPHEARETSGVRDSARPASWAAVSDFWCSSPARSLKSSSAGLTPTRVNSRSTTVRSAPQTSSRMRRR